MATTKRVPGPGEADKLIAHQARLLPSMPPAGGSANH